MELGGQLAAAAAEVDHPAAGHGRTSDSRSWKGAARSAANRSYRPGSQASTAASRRLTHGRQRGGRLN